MTNTPQQDHKNQTDIGSVPVETAAAVPVREPVAHGGSGSWIPAIAVFALLLSLLLVYRTEFSPSSSSAEGIYVVDGLRLTRSYQQKSRNERINGIKSPEQINNEAYAMEQAINNKISEMAADGKIIIQKQSVWAYPPESDITAEVAAAVGIRLVEDAEPLPQRQGNSSGNSIPDSLPEDAALQGGGAELD